MHIFIFTHNTQQNSHGNRMNKKSRPVIGKSSLYEKWQGGSLSFCQGPNIGWFLSNFALLYLRVVNSCWNPLWIKPYYPFPKQTVFFRVDICRLWLQALASYWKPEAISVRKRWPTRSGWKAKLIPIPPIAIVLILSLLAFTGLSMLSLDSEYEGLLKVFVLYSAVHRRTVADFSASPLSLPEFIHLIVEKSRTHKYSASQQFKGLQWPFKCSVL